MPTTFPITNATIAPKPTPTDSASSCEASCRVNYPELYGLSWAREDQIVFTETVTVATISIITSTIGNNTLVRTHTVYDNDANVPLYHTLYHISTDKGGTKVVEAGVTLSDGYSFTSFAYPTPFVDYPSQYHWEGVLPTLGKYDEPVCASWTEELQVAEVTPHPLYPQPTDVIPDKKDPQGVNYVPVWIPLQELPDNKWFDNSFPSESAFVYCESVVGKSPPDVISTAKFVTTTATYQTSMERPGLIHTESRATGWEETPTKGPPGLKPTEQRTVPSSIPPRVSTPSTKPLPTPSSNKAPDVPIIIPTTSSWNNRPTARPSSPPLQNSRTPLRPQPVLTPPNGGDEFVPTGGNGIGAGQPSPSDNNGADSNPGGRPVVTPFPVPNTPIFTFVPTTSNGRPTATPIFIIPGSSSTATIGQTVTFNGQTTVLTAPTAVFVVVPTTIDGTATSTPAFIVGGTSTATIGQTVTIDGHTTVLTAPEPFATQIPTTIFGIATHVDALIISGSITVFPGQTMTLNGQVTTLPTADLAFTTVTTTIDGKETVVPVYIISGSITATIGQTVTIDGTATQLSLPTADLALTSITTTINGKETVIPAYIISGSITATLGQTVTLDGTTTVLSTPTGTDASPASSPTDPGGQPQETGSTKKGDGARSRGVSCSVFAIIFGAVAVMVL